MVSIFRRYAIWGVRLSHRASVSVDFVLERACAVEGGPPLAQVLVYRAPRDQHGGHTRNPLLLFLLETRREERRAPRVIDSRLIVRTRARATIKLRTPFLYGSRTK